MLQILQLQVSPFPSVEMKHTINVPRKVVQEKVTQPANAPYVALTLCTTRPFTPRLQVLLDHHQRCGANPVRGVRRQLEGEGAAVALDGGWPVGAGD